MTGLYRYLNKMKSKQARKKTYSYKTFGFFTLTVKFGITISIFFSIISFQGISQQEITSDTLLSEITAQSDTSVAQMHSPHKASLYSMILPGLGQAYNKKYWKIPIIYAGFGAFYYFVRINNNEYQLWREAYYHTLQYPGGIEPPVNDYEELYYKDPEFMKQNKDYYRRNRDFTYILSAVWYLLNVVDATVDAHLFNWDVSDNITMQIEPRLYTNPVPGGKTGGGVQLSFRF